jgi:hypothetical protein
VAQLSGSPQSGPNPGRHRAVLRVDLQPRCGAGRNRHARVVAVRTDSRNAAGSAVQSDSKCHVECNSLLPCNCAVDEAGSKRRRVTDHCPFPRQWALRIDRNFPRPSKSLTTRGGEDDGDRLERSVSRYIRALVLRPIRRDCATSETNMGQWSALRVDLRVPRARGLDSQRPDERPSATSSSICGSNAIFGSSGSSILPIED